MLTYEVKKEIHIDHFPDIIAKPSRLRMMNMKGIKQILLSSIHNCDSLYTPKL